MQSSAYNNPMFAQGLAQLVQGFIGDPSATARNEEAASRALLNNQTAQYRDAIGESGTGGDLATMMIRSLQAGPEYSGNAPEIGQAALQMGALGKGSAALTPDGEIAGLMRAAMRPRATGGGSGRGGSGGSSGPARDLTQGEIGRVNSIINASGFEGTDQITVLNSIMEAYGAGGFDTLDQAAASILPNVSYGDVEVGVDQNDSLFNPADWFRGPSPIKERQLILPSPSTPAPADDKQQLDTVAVLNEAREAIRMGRDPEAVAARLLEMGIDPSQL